MRLGDAGLCLCVEPPGHSDRLLPAHLQLGPEDADRRADGSAPGRRRDIDVAGGDPAGGAGTVCGSCYGQHAPARDEDRAERLEPGRHGLGAADVGQQLRSVDEVGLRYR